MKPDAGPFRFYVARDPHAVSGHAKVEIWTPGIMRMRPRGLESSAAMVWWLFDILHVFSNRDYAIAIIRTNGTVVHRSFVFPRFFRFPFMEADDLQIGDTWTAPSARGQGLACAALATIVGHFARPGRSFWYVVESMNPASIRVAEKAGFVLAGSGSRRPRFGVPALAAYRIEQVAAPN